MKYWDFIDYLILGGYAGAGIASGYAFYNGYSLFDTAVAGFAVAGAFVTLALVLSGIDKVLQNHYNR